MSLVECSEGILLREALEGIEVKRLFFAASFFFLHKVKRKRLLMLVACFCP